MRHHVTLAALVLLAAGCSPNAGTAPKASAAPSTAPSATNSPSTTTSTTSSPAATPKPAATAAPVTLKLTIDGKPATIEPLAYLLPVTVTGNSSFFWNIGTFAKSGEGNIGQGYGLLKEGEGNVTLHMKFVGDTSGAAALRTMTDAEYKVGMNMTYKEGPKALVWYANSQNLTSGSFTVDDKGVTFKLVATIAGDKNNDGTTRTFDMEIGGLPKP
jgi:hypothetical protein